MSAANHPWIFMGAAVIGLVAAAGTLVWEIFRQEKRRQVVTRDMARLNEQVSVMHKELEQLRRLRNNKNASRKRRPVTSKASVVSDATEFLSVENDFDDASESEFYDCSDDDEGSTLTSLDAILADVDESLEGGVEDAARASERLQDLCFQYPEDPELLWRLGKAYHKMSAGLSELDAKKDIINKGVQACESAINLNPEHGTAHKWLAILVGSRSELQATKQKILDGVLFKTHLDLALKYLPEDASLLHLLGRYSYEIAKLSWVEKKMAAAIAAELPETGYDEALEFCLRAERCAGRKWKENKLLVAKCYVGLGDYKRAVEWLGDADEIAGSSDVDTKVDSEVKALLAKYNSYR